MYHLLVKSSGWGSYSDTIDISRALTSFTEEEWKNIFKPDGKFSVDNICKYPALFMPEFDGGGDQVARVAHITNVTRLNNDVRLTYSYDSSIAPISLTTIKKLSSSLGIDKYQLNRSHWAAINTDLFEELLRYNQDIMPKAEVFSLERIKNSERDLLAVMMPFHPEYDAIYKAIKNMASGMELQCHRADDIWNYDAIIQDVVSLICESTVVICDLSGKNPNVFYEAGIAHTLGKKVILLTQYIDDVPFDLRHLRVVKYLNNEQGIIEMIEKLRLRVSQLIDNYDKSLSI